MYTDAVMQAAWYERQGPSAEVLLIGEMPTPAPGPEEVRIRVSSSGVNPGDVKKRQDAFGLGMAYPRVIPHSDGAGVIDQVGSGVSTSRVGERAWCFGAQSYRPFGTAAEYVVVPSNQAVLLPESVSFDQGACLGIPGITAHRAVHVAGSVDGRIVLVQGGAGAVGQCAIALARHAGSRVIATIRSDRDERIALRAGAHQVVRTDDVSIEETVERLHEYAPEGVDHIVEVAFHANIGADERLLSPNGSIATYATGYPRPTIPFWPLVFKNARLFFLGSDDFPIEERLVAANDLNRTLEGAWPGFEIEKEYPLASIAEAHEAIEQRTVSGRVVVTL